MSTEDFQAVEQATEFDCAGDLTASPIVLIDDEPLIVELYQCYLSASGFENVHSFCNSVDAIESLKSSTPDLILTDVQMPGVSGNFLVRLVRRYPRFEHVPIIAITSDTSDEMYNYLMDNGASAVVHKPVDAERLVEITTIALKRGRELREAAATQK